MAIPKNDKHKDYSRLRRPFFLFWKPTVLISAEFRCPKPDQWALGSAFALTPIDSAAFEYQLADLKSVDRLFAFRDFAFCGFCLSFFNATLPTRTPVRTKPLP